MRIFTDVHALATHLNVRFQHGATVGIDGWPGGDETTLGKALAGELNGATYDLDDALTHDCKSYVPALRLDEIAEAVTVADNEPLKSQTFPPI